MRSTSTLRGINGIFPVIQSLVPEAKSAPFSLSALRGLRVAIDATLVTQRLHFSEDPNASRHLVGFYRLITSLRQVGAIPIMVFDHPYKRLALKEREQLKRRQKRSLDLIRSKLEIERRQRLGDLGNCLKEMQELSAEERMQAGAMLQQRQNRQLADDLMQASEDKLAEERIALLLERYDTPALSLQQQRWQELAEVMRDEAEPLHIFDVEQPSLDIHPNEIQLDDVDAQIDVFFEAEKPEQPQSRSQTIACKIDTLQSQLKKTYTRLESNHSPNQKKLAEGESRVYQTITRQLLDLSSSTTASNRTQADQAFLQALDTIQANAQQVESAATDELIWAESATTVPPAPEPISPSLSSLETMNVTLSKTYAKGKEVLSASVYRDCAKLSSLMAVPVFWTGDGTRTGGGRIHEAEAFAASLVQAGYADLVASEDSDVLLYDAILLRGLLGGAKAAKGSRRSSSDKDKKVEIISSARLRQGLFPYEDVQALANRLAAAKQARVLAQQEEKRLRSKKPTLPESAQYVEVAAPLSTNEYDELAKELMLEYALMCGTDFNQTVPGIGPKTALKLLKEYGSISAVLEQQPRWQPPAGLSIKEYETQLRDARNVFNNPPAVRAVARTVFKAAGVDPTVTTPLPSEQLFDICNQTRSLFDTVATDLQQQNNPAGTSIEFDKAAVVAFLQSHNALYRSQDNDTISPFWRDILDQEDSGTPLATNEPSGAAMLNSDYFGQGRRSDGNTGVACWKPS